MGKSVKFRSKPIEIEAFDMDQGALIPDWLMRHIRREENGAYYVEGKQGWVLVNPGDWIIREMDGSGAYPCAKEILFAKYERIDP